MFNLNSIRNILIKNGQYDLCDKHADDVDLLKQLQHAHYSGTIDPEVAYEIVRMSKVISIDQAFYEANAEKNSARYLDFASDQYNIELKLRILSLAVLITTAKEEENRKFYEKLINSKLMLSMVIFLPYLLNYFFLDSNLFNLSKSTVQSARAAYLILVIILQCFVVITAVISDRLHDSEMSVLKTQKLLKNADKRLQEIYEPNREEHEDLDPFATDYKEEIKKTREPKSTAEEIFCVRKMIEQLLGARYDVSTKVSLSSDSKKYLQQEIFDSLEKVESVISTVNKRFIVLFSTFLLGKYVLQFVRQKVSQCIIGERFSQLLDIATLIFHCLAFILTCVLAFCIMANCVREIKSIRLEIAKLKESEDEMLLIVPAESSSDDIECDKVRKAARDFRTLSSSSCHQHKRKLVQELMLKTSECIITGVITGVSLVRLISRIQLYNAQELGNIDATKASLAVSVILYSLMQVCVILEFIVGKIQRSIMYGNGYTNDANIEDYSDTQGSGSSSCSHSEDEQNNGSDYVVDRGDFDLLQQNLREQDYECKKNQQLHYESSTVNSSKKDLSPLFDLTYNFETEGVSTAYCKFLNQPYDSAFFYKDLAALGLRSKIHHVCSKATQNNFTAMGLKSSKFDNPATNKWQNAVLNKEGRQRDYFFAKSRDVLADTACGKTQT